MALLTRQRVMGAKIETTVGTYAAPAAAQCVFNVFDANMAIDFDYVDRPGQSALSPLPGTTGPRASEFTFSTNVQNSGSSTNPQWASALLLACGFKASGDTYSPDTGNAAPTTVSLAHHEDGRIRKMAGCVGDVSMTFTAGRPVMANWTFRGKYVAPASGALLTPTYPTAVPPRFASATVTTGGTARIVNEITLNLNNEIKLREDATDDTGYISAVIVNRRITWSIDVEAALAKDFYADLTGNTEAAIVVAIGTGSDGIVTFNSPKAQITNVQPGDREGIVTDNLEFVANRSAAAGDDELTVVFS